MGVLPLESPHDHKDLFVILQRMTGAGQGKGLRGVTRSLASRIDQQADIGMVHDVPIFFGVARCYQKKPVSGFRGDISHQRAVGRTAIRCCQNATAFPPEQQFHLVDHNIAV